MAKMTILIEDDNGEIIQKVINLSENKPSVDLVEQVKWHVTNVMRAYAALFGK